MTNREFTITYTVKDIHHSDTPNIKTVGWQFTGEFRRAKSGEYFLDGAGECVASLRGTLLPRLMVVLEKRRRVIFEETEGGTFVRREEEI